MGTRVTLLLLLLATGQSALFGQNMQDTLAPPREYHVNKWVSLTGLAVALYITTEGHERVYDKATISQERLDRLDPNDVPGIDRIALRQDLSRYKRALKVSDYGITYATLLPALLFIDKDMRKDWLDISIVYAEAQVAVLNVYNYSFIGPTLIERIRPVAYYSDVPLEERILPRNRNSFYSGHTSTVSTFTYFMAQTYLNYHPEFKGKKWLLYGLAAIPPTFVGIKRIQGLKHFPSDVIVGGLVGAAGGIFWPKLHQKSKKKNREMSVTMAYGSDFKMMRLDYKF